MDEVEKGLIKFTCKVLLVLIALRLISDFIL
jgi:hypothetical protein